MKRNIYIAYALWFFGGAIGAGLHRIYCGKFISGFAQMGLYWLGIITAVILIGWPILLIWGIWWIIDVFLTGVMVNEINSEVELESNTLNSEKISAINGLYELYQKGAITEEEYNTRKDILMRS